MSDGAPLASVHRALAPAKINLGLFVGPVRTAEGPGAGDGGRGRGRRQARAGDGHAVDLPGGRADAGGGCGGRRTRRGGVRGGGRRPRGEPRGGGVAPVPCEHRLAGAAVATEHRQADSSGGGPRRRLGRRGRDAASGRPRVGVGRRVVPGGGAPAARARRRAGGGRARAGVAGPLAGERGGRAAAGAPGAARAAGRARAAPRPAAVDCGGVRDGRQAGRAALRGGDRRAERAARAERSPKASRCRPTSGSCTTTSNGPPCRCARRSRTPSRRLAAPGRSWRSVSGSGPTVLGVFPSTPSAELAGPRALAALASRGPASVIAQSVDRAFGSATTLAAGARSPRA